MPSIDEQMAVQAVLAPSPALPLSLQWVNQRDQVVNHMSPPDIAHRGSVSDTSKPVSWHVLCPALHLPKASPSPYSLCKAEDCHRSKVLLLMEQLLISQPKPPLSTCYYKRNYTTSVVAGWRSRPVHHHVSRRASCSVLLKSQLYCCDCQTCFNNFYCLSLQIKMHSNLFFFFFF